MARMPFPLAGGVRKQRFKFIGCGSDERAHLRADPGVRSRLYGSERVKCVAAPCRCRMAGRSVRGLAMAALGRALVRPPNAGAGSRDLGKMDRPEKSSWTVM